MSKGSVSPETLMALDQSVFEIVDQDSDKYYEANPINGMRHQYGTSFPSGDTFSVSFLDLDPSSESPKGKTVMIARHSTSLWEIDYEHQTWLRIGDDPNPLQLGEKRELNSNVGEKRAQRLLGVLELIMTIEQTRND